ncbi:hypothetical protein BC832DRAFT_533773 [Gaertneriomyces semiglobifer]|nr:hypothetical protein BC832DRAFT_533773 [Gaertneriomyces semiglobifer]
MSSTASATSEQQPSPSFQQPTHHDMICGFLYHQGFLQGMYADLIVCVRFLSPALNGVMNGAGDECVYKLHRIVACRSPFLAQMLRESGADNLEYGHIPTLHIPVSDPNLTPDGLHLAFGHLYASFASQHLQLTSTPNRSALLRSVFSASNLLVLTDLAQIATSLIKSDINRQTIIDYTNYVSSGVEFPGMKEIREAVVTYLYRGLVRDIVEEFGVVWGNRDGEGWKELINAFKELPFEWLKKVVESKGFEVPSDMERRVNRKETVISARASPQKNAKSLLAGEENVLMQFGSGGSGVTIVRKALKSGGGRGVGQNPQMFTGERRVWKAGH